MAKILGVVRNGNYFVEIYEDGTKVRVTDEENFKPAYAECIDVTITKKCDGGCKYCYMGCTEKGEHSTWLTLATFADNIEPLQEIAINVNDMSHPRLQDFLYALQRRCAIANLTINQKHFTKNVPTLIGWQSKSLFKGIGISYIHPEDMLIEQIKRFDNSVIHVIAGIFSEKDFNYLKNKGLKILILGYKGVGRGDEYYNRNRKQIESRKQWLREHIYDIINEFDVVSFDNSALLQLDMFGKLPKYYFDRHYMGNEGEFTFYVDLVSETFALNSMESQVFPMMEYPYDLSDMFQFIRTKYKDENAGL